ncbi:hypothetical protein [Aeromonas dhakensis]|uniref:hypothetical protein n=1 Tax=Aeromonas dhakensis TaxID=196024 RepID=UPI002B4A33C0|nr:hypothetical protein [Aeromonas dhakensis]
MKITYVEFNDYAMTYYMKPVIDSLKDLGYQVSETKISDKTCSVETDFGRIILKIDDPASGTGEFILQDEDQIRASLVRFGGGDYHVRTDRYQQALVAEIAETLTRDNTPDIESCKHESIPLCELHNIAWMFGTEHKVDRDVILVKVDEQISVQLEIIDDYFIVTPVIAGHDDGGCFHISKYDFVPARTVENLKSKCREIYADVLAKQVSELLD